MADFLTYDHIRLFNKDKFLRSLVENAERRNKSGATFLSYSTLDDEFLPTIIGILEDHGASVYVDKKDSTLPPTTNRETAAILRSNIALSSKFVLFVTPNSKESSWIPWELGLADGEKTRSKIALFPAAEHSDEQQWSEQEYLGLYDRIVWGHFKDQKNDWLVVDHAAKTAVSLGRWLRR
jgi:hypothetical protein